MSDMKDEKKPQQEEHYSLNDDRRVKVLSPGALVAKRFFRNRLAVLGMVMLAGHVCLLLCGRTGQPLWTGRAVLHL